MRTYSHAIIGAFWGLTLFPLEPEKQVFCVAGSVLPDIFELTPKTRLHHAPLHEADEAARSFLICGGVAALGAALFYGPVPVGGGSILAFCAGWFLGQLVVDAFTHTDPKNVYWGSTPTMLWPMSLPVAHCFTAPLMQRLFGEVWDYRREDGSRMPKALETCLDLAFAALGTLSWLQYHH